MRRHGAATVASGAQSAGSVSGRRMQPAHRRRAQAGRRNQRRTARTAGTAGRFRHGLRDVLELFDPAADPRNDGPDLRRRNAAGVVLGHVHRDAGRATALRLAHLAVPAQHVPAVDLPVLHPEHPRLLRLVQRAGRSHVDRARLFHLGQCLQPVRRRRFLEPDGGRVLARAGGPAVRLHRGRAQSRRPVRPVPGQAARAADRHDQPAAGFGGAAGDRARQHDARAAPGIVRTARTRRAAQIATRSWAAVRSRRSRRWCVRRTSRSSRCSCCC